jgi:hypothetical protein
MAEVFAFITDPESTMKWHTGTMEHHGMPNMPVGSQGTLVTMVVGRRVESHYTVLENDGHSETRAKTNQGPLRFDTTQTVKQISKNRTRVTIKTSIDAGMFFHLAEPALESVVISRMDADLAQLKAVLEFGTKEPG